VASPTPEPLDVTAIQHGFAGPYRFVARLADLPDMTAAAGTVKGIVTDPAHYVLEFPGSSFVTRYVRSGGDAVAVIDGQQVPVQTGSVAYGAISPEDMMPTQLWAMVVAPWAATLEHLGAGAYAAPSAILTTRADRAGYRASDWQLSAATDGTGRLTSLSFRGLTATRPFVLDLAVTYD
jgi:hypothetical protein